jgi:predicted DNA-binding transcriptional regulator AlpA
MDALHEAQIAEFLGPRYAGRRYLRYSELEELGIVANRATLKLWMDAGAFPRGIKIAGRFGRTLVWSVPEIVQALAERVAERDTSSSPENEEGAPSQGRPSDSTSPLAAGHSNKERRPWIYDPLPT